MFSKLLKLLVTPVVALLTEPSIIESFVPCPGEVERIFNHPLEAILDLSLASKEELSPKGSPDWPYEEDLYVRHASLCVLNAASPRSQNFSDIELPWLGNSTYRMHRFRSTAFAIKGLTADILVRTVALPGASFVANFIFMAGQISTAIIAYDKQPPYERWAPRQLRTFSPILRILKAQIEVQHAVSGTSTPTPKVEVGVPSGLENAVVSADK
ncbi:hypothetical protein TRAPUB_3295 [Trametes pubescens]|uniref:Uncharacterized protein n=1 Tax=Trametes pubescens TaxID=154538 RepID=A0A1M2VE25_TRAPU|nr:hypothetical protein TRAPUB_3295 [Trametes pubescens]